MTVVFIIVRILTIVLKCVNLFFNKLHHSIAPLAVIDVLYRSYRGEEMADKSVLVDRSEVPVVETWNLESIFATVDEWRTAIGEVEEALPEVSRYSGSLKDGAGTLLACLAAFEAVFRKAMKVAVYAMLRNSVDTADQEALGMFGQARGLMARTGSAGAFIEPEILEIGVDTLREWSNDDEKLAVYAHYFDTLELKRAHLRSAEAEELLAMAGEPLGTSMAAYGALTNADMTFSAATTTDGASIDVGQSSIVSLLTNTDRKARETAYKSYADAYLAHKNTIAAVQQGAIQNDVFQMRAHRYESCLEASLYPNNIPVEVYHNLIRVFQENLPTWHRYWAARRKALGVDQFEVYDIRAPVTEDKEHVPYGTAVDWICEGMAPLGDEYVSIMRNGCTKDRWVDRAINKGKRQGAFSSGSHDTQPFVLLSYADDVFSLSTLAHELGHSMHSYYSRREQPFIYSHYSLFVAEVASNFNQAMVRSYLLENKTEKSIQIGLIEEAMSNFHRYFFVMPTLARWELEMHERVEAGKPVNAEIMSDRCAELFREGYGDEVVFDRDRIGITWAQFGHMYRNFYVYQYATGIAAAHALNAMVLDGNEQDVERYLSFLKTGDARYPLDALQAAGVDMMSPEPVKQAFDAFAGIVDKFDTLVNG